MSGTDASGPLLGLHGQRALALERVLIDMRRDPRTVADAPDAVAVPAGGDPPAEVTGKRPRLNAWELLVVAFLALVIVALTVGMLL
jgi:hypothetical protein